MLKYLSYSLFLSSYSYRTLLNSFIIIMDPFIGAFENEGCKNSDNDEHHPCHSRCVAHVKIFKSTSIHIKHIKKRAVHWSTICDNEAWCKRHKSLDRLHDRIKKDNRCQKGYRNFEKLLPWFGPIDTRGFIIRLRNIP